MRKLYPPRPLYSLVSVGQAVYTENQHAVTKKTCKHKEQPLP